ncbi:MAG: LysR family transcriptional regulator [Granulosicoccus sp.]
MDWDNARYFLAIARDGTMLGAARKLGVSQALLSRRLSALEESLGTRLLDRSTKGCVLNEKGQEIFAAAERAEAALSDGVASLGGADDEVSGTVRIGSPDGFGSAFLAPRLEQFVAAYPSLRVQLVPVSRSFSLSQREADIAVMVGRPERGRLRVRRLTPYSLGIYASESYLTRVGHPVDVDALSQHILIGYVDDLLPTPELSYARELLGEHKPNIEISTAIGQLEAVMSGAGIGVLHDFMASGREGLVQLFPERKVLRTYWSVWHENMHAARRVKAVVQMLDTLVRSDASLFTGEL